MSSVEERENSQEAPEEVTQVPTEELEKRIAELESKANEFEDLWKRALADLDNYRKRMLREQERVRFEEQKNAVTILLDVLDNLGRAVGSATDQDPAFIEGLKAILVQAESSLAKLGAERIETVGAKFDPSFHGAISVVEGDEDNVITDEHRTGYRLGDYVIRPALVTVTRKKVKASEGSEAK
ncbi:MAG: nucleotide exchange factor GrpE [Planctomycetota bacterium]